MIAVFAESDNDRRIFIELLRALAPHAGTPKPLRKVEVMIRGRAAAEQRKEAQSVTKALAALRVAKDVRGILAHQDCDAIEPAHEALASTTERLLQDATGLPCVAPAPAWETETWLFQWPRAVAAYRPSWNRLNPTGRIGLWRNTKEKLKRELRPKGKGRRVADYEESDGPEIVNKAIEIRELWTPAPGVRCDSYDRFVRRLGEVF